MKLSTIAELAGFALLSFAAYSWNAILGLAVAGAFLLLIGYGIEDEVVGLSLARMGHPLTRFRVWLRHRREAKE